jgi:hypothetical protein
MKHNPILRRLKSLVLLGPIGLGVIGVLSGLQGCTLFTTDPILTSDGSDLYGAQRPFRRSPYSSDPYRSAPGTDPDDADPYGTAYGW